MIKRLIRFFKQLLCSHRFVYMKYGGKCSYMCLGCGKDIVNSKRRFYE